MYPKNRLRRQISGKPSCCWHAPLFGSRPFPASCLPPIFFSATCRYFLSAPSHSVLVSSYTSTHSESVDSSIVVGLYLDFSQKFDNSKVWHWNVSEYCCLNNEMFWKRDTTNDDTDSFAFLLVTSTWHACNTATISETSWYISLDPEAMRETEKLLARRYW